MAEKKLWSHLRNKQLENIRLRRQVILGNYILDFISLDQKIIIELDGSQHLNQVAYDQTRTAYLSSLGYKVLRYWNHDVLVNVEIVLQDIYNYCVTPPIRPLATFPRVGEGVLSSTSS